MDKPLPIYVVTVGEYSDYHIFAIYFDRDLAEQCAEMLGEDAQVEEHPTRDELPIRASELTRDFSKYEDKETRWKYDDVIFVDEMDKVEVHDVQSLLMVRGHNHAMVDKIFRERLAKYKASKEGL